VAEHVRTLCLRDCPDACGLIAEVEGGAITALRGDPDHPITRGFICRRTKRDYPAMLTRPDRIVRPRLRTPAGWQDIGWDEALDLCADRLQAVIQQYGPQAVLFAQNGGSLGLSAEVCRYLFDEIGATQVAGGVCMDAGEWAQEADFGEQRVSDWSGLEQSAGVVLWGRNVHTASPHLLPHVRAARARGAEVVLIDPLPTATRALATRYVQPRPGRDAVLALAVARLLFEEDLVPAEAAASCDGLDGFRALATRRTLAEAAAECDVPEAEIHALARLYGERRPVATFIGGGPQRWVDGAETVRIIDALCAVAGQVGVRGGGVAFETPRRRGLALKPRRAPRTVRAAFLGHDILYAKEPRIRFGWIQRANPVATYPDSLLVERALRSLRFLVVVDAFLTDTAASAHLVLPPALMLEHDDLVGSYGHHQIGLARRVVPPPAEARTDLEIAQALARQLGLQPAVAGGIDVWIDRFLAPLGLNQQALARGAVTRPGEPAVAFEGRRFATASGRANLITAFDPHVEEDGPSEDDGPAGYPLHLLTVSPIEWQASQVPPDARDLPEVTAHPETAGVGDRADGAEVTVRTRIGLLRARLRLDPAMRRDTLLIFRGGWVRHGRGVNAIVAARQSRHGGQAAYLDERARLE
jgi:anaerobic selenocysteine-containing dehydrogenase